MLNACIGFDGIFLFTDDNTIEGEMSNGMYVYLHVLKQKKI